jgi:hypothetical protein
VQNKKECCKNTELTTQNKPRKAKYKGISLNPYLYGIGGLSLLFLLYIIYRMYITDKNLIPISIFALIAGAIFEAKFIMKKWGDVLGSALLSFFLSFLSFLPGKRERHYDFENHIQIWPFCFLIFFLIFIIAFNKDKVVPKLTEGITLLQSIAVLYWIFDFGLLENHNLFLFLIFSKALLFSLFSIFHAFTHTELTKTNRLILSIWSTIIFVLFAVENIIRTFQNGQIENSQNLTSGFYIAVQYFLLGVSGVYIVQNFAMLIAFLPGKGTFFNKQYYKDLKELKNDHINRYSFQQVKILHSLCCIIITGGLFFLNYYYKVMPKHIAIWLVFVTFPLILNFLEYYKNKD